MCYNKPRHEEGVFLDVLDGIQENAFLSAPHIVVKV